MTPAMKELWLQARDTYRRLRPALRLLRRHPLEAATEFERCAAWLTEIAADIREACDVSDDATPTP